MTNPRKEPQAGRKRHADNRVSRVEHERVTLICFACGGIIGFCLGVLFGLIVWIHL
jgi:hypothetical protein